MIILLLAILLFPGASTVCGQAVWAVTSAPSVSDRYDDIYFLNSDTGWAISLYFLGNQQGQVLRTYNGGNTWQTLVSNSTSLYRDIGFLDAQTGFIGTLSPDYVNGDTVCMYKTTDAGTTWLPVTNLSGPKDAGICGMRVINDSTIYATGRFLGPPGFYKTTNKGLSWTYKDMSAYAKGLVDIFFFSADTGIAVGTLGNFSSVQPFFDSCGMVLYTTDGGNTWQQKMRTGRNNEVCWKISFPSRNTGYISIEANSGLAFSPQYLLKTIDGGITWQQILYCNDGNLEAQGIGFINDSVGWIGGRKSGSGPHAYQTIDGGSTWTPEYSIINPNRFRFLSDSTGYVSGQHIYKLHYTPCIHYNTTHNIQICAGTSYSFAGQYLNTTGTYHHVFTSVCGVDSNVTLQLIATYELHGSQELQICHDDSLYYKGKYYYTGNYFNDTVHTSGGCDSVIHLHVQARALTVKHDTICDGSTYFFGHIVGQYLTQSGIYFDTLYNPFNGCDSIIQLNLNVRSIQNIEIDTFIVQGGIYILPSGDTVTQADTYYSGPYSPNCIWTITNLSVVSSVVEVSRDNESITLRPSPVTTQLFIQTSGTEIERVNIYNTTGSLVMAAASLINNQLSIINLPSGVYIAEIKTKESSIRKRWIKM